VWPIVDRQVLRLPRVGVRDPPPIPGEQFAYVSTAERVRLVLVELIVLSTWSRNTRSGTLAVAAEGTLATDRRQPQCDRLTPGLHEGARRSRSEPGRNRTRPAPGRRGPRRVRQTTQGSRRDLGVRVVVRTRRQRGLETIDRGPGCGQGGHDRAHRLTHRVLDRGRLVQQGVEPQLLPGGQVARWPGSLRGAGVENVCVASSASGTGSSHSSGRQCFSSSRRSS
jgi:hypothetical protein